MPKADAQTDTPASTAGAATRDRLLAAAATLVAERGWGKVTTRAVAERAGVNQALVHYHFGNMEALLRTALLARLEPELIALMQPLEEDGSFSDSLRSVVDRLDRFDFSSETGDLLGEMLLRATRDESIADAMGTEVRAMQRLVQPSIARAQEQGEVRDDISAETLSLLILATLDGFLLQRLADPAPVQPEVVADALARLLTP